MKKTEYCVGEKIRFNIVLKNESNLYMPCIIIYQSSNLINFKNIQFLNRKQEKLIKDNITFYNRGIYEIGILSVEATDLLGIVTVSKKIEINNKIIVYPKVNKLKDRNEISVINEEYTEILNELMNDEFVIKKYEDSDQIKCINWKISAKLNELYVKKYKTNTYNKILIVIDMNKNNFNFDKKGYIEEKLIESALSIISILKNKNVICNVLLLKKYVENYCIENIYDYNKFKYEMIFKKSDGSINLKDIFDFINDRNNLILFTIRLEKDFIRKIKHKISEQYRLVIFYYINFDIEVDFLQDLNIEILDIKEVFKEGTLDESVYEKFI